MSTTAYSMGSSTAVAMPLQGDEPRRMQWSLFVVAIGCIAMFAGLVLAIAGVPGKLGYNINGPGARIKNTSYDPMKMSAAIDANIKLVAEGSGFEPDQLNGYFLGVSRSEDQIPLLAKSALEMGGSVTTIDQGLKDVYGTTSKMRANMQAMAATSDQAASTMQGLSSDVGSLADAMAQLAAATKQLTAAMSGIEGKATTIASKRTSAAVQITHRMNKVLPSKVATPQTSTDPAAAYTRGAV